MSGPIHTKGVLILAGFLRSRFASAPAGPHGEPVFEQNYGGVEGTPRRAPSCTRCCRASPACR